MKMRLQDAVSNDSGNVGSRRRLTVPKRFTVGRQLNYHGVPLCSQSVRGR